MVCDIVLAPALGHTYGPAATCVDPQLCTVCNVVLAPALGHTPGEQIVVLDPTCLEEGRWEIICDVCDALLEFDSIDALGHDWSEFEVCEDDDTKEFRVCATCGEVEIEDREVWEVLDDRSEPIIQSGLTINQLHLSANNNATLSLVLTGLEPIVLNTKANNRNVEGIIALGDGYYLRFDIKGNGSNIKVFEVFQVEINIPLT